MKVDLIRKYAAQYRTAIDDGAYLIRPEKYQLLTNYEASWDLSALDLTTMYERCFQSDISGSLWGGSKYSAKESMLALIEHDPHFVRQMFRDLYNDRNDLTLRMDRFVHHCDALAKDIKQQTGHWIDAHHSYREASLYLALEYPEKYTLFDATDAAKAFSLLGAKQVLQPHQIVKFITLAQTLYKLLVDDLLIKSYSKHIVEFKPTTMIVHDFCNFLSGKTQ